MARTIEWATLRKLLEYPKPQELSQMIQALYFENNNLLERLAESVSYNQMASKDALFCGAAENNVKPKVYDYEDNTITIEVIGGWFGWPMMKYIEDYFSDYTLKIKFFELDASAIEMAKRWQEVQDSYLDIKYYNQNWFDYKVKRRVHVIINTSCEHMPDLVEMKQYITEPYRTTLFLTSNNKTDEPDHINCKDGVNEFAEDNDVKVLHGESIVLSSVSPKTHRMKDYKRHILVGRWK